MSESDKTFGAALEEAAKKLVEDDIQYAHSIDTSGTVVSEKAMRRVRRLIKNYEANAEKVKRPAIFRRAVAAIIIACTVSFSLCLSIDAVREKIFDTIVSWYDKFVSVFYVADETSPEVIEEYKEPTIELPGLEKVVVFQNEKLYYIDYISASKTLVSYQQMTITDYSNDIDKEKCVSEQVDINGNSGQIFSYGDDELTITWHDNEYRYVLISYSSEVSQELLINMATSVK